MKQRKVPFLLKRDNLEKLIQDGLTISNRFFLYGLPKTGKTTLCKNMGSTLKKKMIYIDLQYCQNELDFQTRIIKSIIKNNLEKDNVEEIKANYIGFNLKIYHNYFENQYDIDLPLIKNKIDIKSFLKNFKKNQKKHIIILDNIEFLMKDEKSKLFLHQFIKETEYGLIIIQNKILDIEISEAIKIYPSHEVTFTSESSYYKYILDLYKTKNIFIDYDLFNKAIKETGDFLEDNQTIFEMIYEIIPNGTKIDQLFIENAIDHVIYENQQLFEDLFFNLEQLEQDLLRCLSEDKNMKLYGKDIMEKLKYDKPIHSMAINRTLDVLQIKKIVYKDGKSFKFFNPYFRKWINNNFKV